MSENSNNSDTLKCPFRATLITRSFACSHASEVTRREGPDIGCDSAELNEKCEACFTALKRQALPELGYTDDLTTMPASVTQKIQYGGLLALQKLVLPEGPADKIDDISILVAATLSRYGDAEQLPFAECIEGIKQYKMKRRRGR